MKLQKLKDLVRELSSEAWHEGYYEGIYNHGTNGHKLSTRQDMLARRQIKEQIKTEIEHEINITEELLKEKQ